MDIHRQRHGQSTTEYGLALGLIAAILIVALTAVNGGVGGVFSGITQQLTAAVGTNSAPTGSPAAAPTALVTPAIQLVGQQVTVTGTGYTPDSPVTITLHSTPTVLGTTTSSATGSVDATVTIPAGTDTSITHTITLSTTTQTGVSNDLTVLAPACTGSMICGTVVDASGSPVPGESITAQPDGWAGPSARTATDAQGNYALSLSAPGTYQVIATAGANQLALAYTTSGPTGDLPQGTPITVGASAVSGIDVRLPVFYTIAGTMTDASGALLTNESVGAVVSFPDHFSQSPSVLTDGQGRFSVPVIDGAYQIVAHALATSPAAQTGPTFAYTPGQPGSLGGWNCTTPSLSVVGGSIAGLQLQLPPMHTISGMVAGSSGADSGWRVNAVDTTVVDGCSSGYSAGILTATSGAYALTVPDGSYEIVVDNPPSPATSYFYASGGTTTTAPGTLVPVSGSAVAGVDITTP